MSPFGVYPPLASIYNVNWHPDFTLKIFPPDLKGPEIQFGFFFFRTTCGGVQDFLFSSQLFQVVVLAEKIIKLVLDIVL